MDCHARRFIPAGAGNTAKNEVVSFRLSVYPRWRGEHLKWSNTATVGPGLSPLARGTHLLIWRSTAWYRFIPAGAGNTRNTLLLKLSSPVYPRWRGEHFKWQYNMKIAVGLSPLARGTQSLLSSFALRSAVYPRWRGEHTS